MTVEDQHSWVTPLLRQPPPSALIVWEIDFGGYVASVKAHLGSLPTASVLSSSTRSTGAVTMLSGSGAGARRGREMGSPDLGCGGARRRRGRLLRRVRAETGGSLGSSTGLTSATCSRMSQRRPGCPRVLADRSFGPRAWDGTRGVRCRGGGDRALTGARHRTPVRRSEFLGFRRGTRGAPRDGAPATNRSFPLGLALSTSDRRCRRLAG